MKTVLNRLTRHLFLLLMLVAAVGGFFFLFELFARLTSSGPADLLAAAPSESQAVRIPSNVGLTAILALLTSLILVAGVVVFPGRWLARRGYQKSRRIMIVGGVVGLILIGLVLFLAASGLFTPEAIYEQHQIHQTEVLPVWLLVVAGFFLFIVVAAIVKPRRLVLMLMLMPLTALVLGLFTISGSSVRPYGSMPDVNRLLLFGLVDVAGLSGLRLFDRVDYRASPEYGDVVNSHRKGEYSSAGLGVLTPQELIRYLGTANPKIRAAAAKDLIASGAFVTLLENGGSIVSSGGVSWWVPGVTTAQTIGVPHNPVFEVRGAGHTGYLRTATGDVYEDGHWRQLDPLRLPYEDRTEIPGMVRSLIAAPAGDMAALPEKRLNSSLLAGYEVAPVDAHTDQMSVSSVSSRYITAGVIPSSLRLDSFFKAGELNPFSSTFSVETLASAYYWSSTVPTFSEQQLLQAAAASDPTYTQLPEGLPSRVRELALKVTAGYESPYEKAKALEEYLSAEYTYAFADAASESDRLPDGRDPVDWFLFDHREGTSGVHSSAFVVLARSVGIPSRVVSGWAIGKMEGSQTVYADQAHQWAEVAFEGLGWITFEPTAAGAPSRTPEPEKAAPGDASLELERLLHELLDDDSEVRRAAAEALGLLGDPAAIGPLADRALLDPDEGVRLAAVEALVQLDHPEALERLMAALSDDDPDVRRAAEEALDRIIGAMGNVTQLRITQLENGGSIVEWDDGSWWVPGVTTAQTNGAPHSPIFGVRGAGHTGYLRTATGDLYEDGRWRQLDPLSLPYEGQTDVPDMVRSLIAAPDDEMAALPEGRLNPSLLAGYEVAPVDAHTDGVLVSGLTSRSISAGVVPTSLQPNAIFRDGELNPFSATFSMETPAYSYFWSSTVPTFSEQQMLRAAVASDPTYTQLPEGLPSRIRELALEVTAAYESPYEKAKALEEYLSTEYTYAFADADSESGVPPPGRDPVDWFLFDHREGTSGVHSSAFVVLARSVGIPSRVVSGWAIGMMEGSQTVYADQAHQWAEVAFEGLGWVTFEPTAAGAPSRTPEPEEAAPADASPELERLLQELLDDDPEVRKAAADALGRLGHPGAIGPLADRALFDPDEGVRMAAVEALVQLGFPEALHPLVAGLFDDDPDVRRAAAEALGRLGHPGAIEHLANRALRDPDEGVRLAAVEALVQLDHPEALELLLEALSDDDPRVRRAAAEALGHLGDPAAMEPLVGVALFDPQEAVRQAAVEAAVEALIQLDHPEALERLMAGLFDDDPDVRRAAAEALGLVGDPAAVELLVGVALFDPEEAVRWATVEALRNLDHAGALGLLLEALYDGDPDVRKAAAEALGLFGDSAAVGPLVEAALFDPDEAVRWAAVEALIQLDHPEALARLVEALHDGDWTVRRAAAEALGHLGDPAAMEPLVEAALFDPEEVVRQAAVEALIQLEHPEALERLVEALSDDDSWVRRAAAEALGLLGDPAAVEPLVGVALFEPEEAVLRAAVEALRKLDHAEALALLLEALYDGGPDVRKAAAEALGLLGDPAAVEPLVETVLFDKDSGVRLAAMETLLNLESPEMLDLLVSGLFERDPAVRKVAVEALVRLGGPGAVGPLVERVGRDTDASVRLTIMLGLIELGYTDIPLAGLFDDDPAVRKAAAEALGRLGDPAVLGPLVKAALSDLNEGVRHAAADALGKLDSPRVLERIVKALLHRDQRVRKAAIEVLGRLGDPAAVGPLVERARVDWDEGVRKAAVDALTSMGRLDALDPLTRLGGSGDHESLAETLLTGEDPGDRAAAAKALGEIGGSGALQSLAKALADEDGRVAEAAARALVEIGASVTPLENGGSLVIADDLGYWVPNTTTAQSPGLAHNPAFQVSGALHTGYLRTAVGDVYRNGRWLQSDPVELRYEPPAGVRQLVAADMDRTGGLLSSMPPQRLDRTLLAGYQPSSTESFDYDVIRIEPLGTLKSLPAGTMPTSLHLQQIGLPGSFWPYSATFSTEEGVREYSWTSAVPRFYPSQLEGASVSPDPHYTQLPEGLPSRIRELALEITAGYGSPYAKAKAIESYLQETYPYRLADSPDDFVPPGRDPVDWFLFDHREGTCGVYSSAFVVLARSVGLPARVVSGWAIGATDGTQTVYSDQAHQWAEVPFDRLGWVTFEPTGAGGAPSRVGATMEALDGQGSSGDQGSPAETLLTGEDPGDRAAAADALGEIGGSGALQSLAKALTDEDGRVTEAAARALTEIGATVIPLENGGSLVIADDLGYWVPNTTTGQSAGLAHNPVFQVSGAAHTSYLRTAVGDVYRNGRWLQSDPVELRYEPPAGVRQLVAADMDRTGGLLSSMPPQRLDRTLLAGYQPSSTESFDYNVIHIAPLGTLKSLPAGTMPTSPHLQQIGLPGSFWPYSATFSTEEGAREYSWTSAVPRFYPSQLEGASVSSDPHYTQLPEGLPSRIRELALEITAGYGSPYAKAKAIESYLRETYPYRFADSPEDFVPPGRDPVDWFLFDHREGTCGVYSSAFVVLARSVGLPARVVSGWAIGATDGTQTVYSDQAHQWAEVPFDRLGWVTFEPTGAADGPLSRIEATGPLVHAAPEPSLQRTVTEITRWPSEARKGVLFTIDGTVRTTVGLPVTGMEVEIFINETKEHGGLKIGSGVTRQGGFEIEITVPTEFEEGSYQLIAHAIGSSEYRESWSDPEISIYSGTEFQLTGPTEHPVDVEAVFRGKLFEETGVAVSGQEVQIRIDGQALPSMSTDVQGAFSFSTTFHDPGQHQIEVEFGETEFLLGNVARMAIAIILPTEIAVEAPGRVRTGEEFRISGALRDVRGSPLPQQALALVLDGVAGFSPQTDQEGRFEVSLSVDEPGIHEVEVSFQGQGVIQPSTSRLAFRVTEPTSMTVQGVKTVPIGEPFRVTGVLLGPEGERLGGRSISVAIDGRVESTAQTDQEGEFEVSLSVDEPGTHEVEAVFQGEGALEPSSSRLAFSALEPTFLNIQGVRTVLVGQLVQLAGSLSDAGGEPLPSQAVTVAIDGQVESVLETDLDGRFDEGLPVDETGVHFIEVTYDGEGSFDSSSNMASFSVVEPTSLTVQGAKTVRLGQPFQLTGSLLDTRGESIPNQAVTVAIDGQIESTLDTGADGTFTWDAIFQREAELGISVGFLGTDHLAPSQASLPVTVGVPLLVMEAPEPVVRGETAKLRGVVIVAGKFVPGIGITINGEGYATSSPAGVFVMRYPIEPDAPLGGAVLDVAAPSLEASTEVSIEISSETELAVGAPSQSGAREEFVVSGTLRDSLGEPLGGRSISLSVGGSPVEVPPTDAQGNFRVSHTEEEPGEYEVAAAFDGEGYILPSTARTSVAVRYATDLTVRGPRRIGRGETAAFVGELTAAPGSPLAEAELSVADRDGRLSTTVTPDDSGRFELLHSFEETGPVTLTVSLPASGIWSPSSGSIAFDVVDATVLTIQGAKTALLGEPYRVAGALRGLGGEPIAGQPVTVGIDGRVESTLDTGPDGSFAWETVFDGEAESAVSVDFGGTDRLSAAHAALRVTVGVPLVVIEPLEPVARGDTVTLRGSVVVGSELMPEVEVTVGGEEYATTNGAGAFVIRYPVAPDARLGTTELVVAAPELDASARVPLWIKSTTGMIVVSTEKVRLDRPLLLEATLLDDRGSGIPGARLRSGEVAALTDARGIAALALAPPAAEDISIIPVTVAFDGDDSHHPMVYTVGVPVPPRVFNWLLWVGLPLLLACVSAAGYWGGRRASPGCPSAPGAWGIPGYPPLPTPQLPGATRPMMPRKLKSSRR